MTKTLLLMRHAKSSWDDPALDDRDRPLNARGRKSAPRMGHLWREKPIAVDLVLSSSSVRTRQTAELVFAELDHPPPIVFYDELYHATPDRITARVSEVIEPTRNVMVLGHNPGLEELLDRLVSESIHFPTAGLAMIELDIDQWQFFDDQTRGTLKEFWRPKDLPDG